MATQADHDDITGAPLAGLTVVVTRSAEQAGQLAQPLATLGAEVLVMPVIAIVEPDDWGPADAAIQTLASYDWVVLTSANAVDRFFGRLATHGLEPREALDGVKVAVVGSATASRLEEHLVHADLVPADFRAEGLVEAFRALGDVAGLRILVPRALQAREVLPYSLRELGATVDVVPVYRTVPAEPDEVVLGRLREGSVAAVTFTSPSTVKNFAAVLERAGLDPQQVLASLVKASIGPVTTEALHKLGMEADIEAEPSTVTALVEALAARLSERP